jgi:hypothetical protein
MNAPFGALTEPSEALLTPFCPFCQCLNPGPGKTWPHFSFAGGEGCHG